MELKFAYGHTTKKWLSWDLNSDLTPKSVPWPLHHPASQTRVWVFVHLSFGCKSLGKILGVLELQSHWLKGRHIMTTYHILFGPGFMELMLVPFRGLPCLNITSLCFSSIAPLDLAPLFLQWTSCCPWRASNPAHGGTPEPQGQPGENDPGKYPLWGPALQVGKVHLEGAVQDSRELFQPSRPLTDPQCSRNLGMRTDRSILMYSHSHCRSYSPLTCTSNRTLKRFHLGSKLLRRSHFKLQDNIQWGILDLESDRSSLKTGPVTY